MRNTLNKTLSFKMVSWEICQTHLYFPESQEIQMALAVSHKILKTANWNEATWTVKIRSRLSFTSDAFEFYREKKLKCIWIIHMKIWWYYELKWNYREVLKPEVECCLYVKCFAIFQIIRNFKSIAGRYI